MPVDPSVDRLVSRTTALECRSILTALEGHLVSGVGGDQKLINRIVEYARGNPDSTAAIEESVRRRLAELEDTRAEVFAKLGASEMHVAEAAYQKYRRCLAEADDVEATNAYEVAMHRFRRQRRGRHALRLGVLVAVLALCALGIGSRLRDAKSLLSIAEGEFEAGEWQAVIDSLEWYGSRSALLGSMGLVPLLFASDVESLAQAAAERLECARLSDAVREALLRKDEAKLLHLMTQFDQLCTPDVVKDIGLPLAGPLRVISEPDAIVSILTADGQLINEARTGDDGSRLFYLLDEGVYTVRVAKQDYEPSETIADLRWGEVAEASLKIRLKPGHVVFHGQDSAEIWLDDRLVGASGKSIGPLAPGQHRFVFRQQDFHEAEILAEVPPGATVEYEAPPMRLHTGFADILPVLASNTNSVLDGMGVYRLEGKEAVTTQLPARNQLLPVGLYRIRVRLSKHTPKDDDIPFEVFHDQTTRVIVPFSPLPARVIVGVDTPGAVIEGKGSFRAANGEEILLTAGVSHRLLVSAPMHESVEVVIPRLPPDGSFTTNLTPLVRSPPFNGHFQTYRHRGNAYTRVRLSVSSSNWLVPEGRDIILLVDASRRRGNWRADWAQILEACSRSLQPKDRFQVVRFADRMETSSPELAYAAAFEWDKATRLLRRPPLGVDSDLFAALRRVTEERNRMVENRPLFVIVLTDGFPTTGLLSQLEMLERIDTLNRKGLLVYGIISAAPERSLFDLLSHRTGGETVFVKDLGSVPQHLMHFLRSKRDVGMSGSTLTLEGNNAGSFVTPRLLGDVCLIQGAEFYLKSGAEIENVVIRLSGFSGGRIIHHGIRLNLALAGEGRPEIANQWANSALRDRYWELIETISAHHARLPQEEAKKVREQISHLRSSYNIVPYNQKEVYPFADLNAAPRR